MIERDRATIDHHRIDMKTSYILLTIIAIVTLTGMIATDVLLKQKYTKIDWHNAYQNFEHRPLPAARHWVVEGTPVSEIIIQRSTGKSQALVAPDQVKFYQIRQQSDTIYVTFAPDFNNYRDKPRDVADYELATQLVLQLPDIKTLRIKNSRLTLGEFTADKLKITLQNSRLRTNKLRLSDSLDVTASQNSFVVLGATDHYKSLRMVVQDSSGLQLNNTPIEAFDVVTSPSAEVQLRAQALKWLK